MWGCRGAFTITRVSRCRTSDRRPLVDRDNSIRPFYSLALEIRPILTYIRYRMQSNAKVTNRYTDCICWVLLKQLGSAKCPYKAEIEIDPYARIGPTVTGMTGTSREASGP